MRDVVFLQRKRLAGYSIEGYFDSVRAALSPRVRWRLVHARHESVGLWRRLWTAAEAALRQAPRGGISHVAGDIHYVTLLLAPRRTVLSVMDCGFLNHPSPAKRAVLGWLWLTLPVRRAAAITTISEFTRQQVIAHAGCRPEKVHVVHVCIAPEFQPVPRPFNAACPNILQVGTSTNKNVERLAEALRGIACTLHVVGPLSASQRGALDGAGIRWRNSVGLDAAAIRRAYAEADLVAFASTYEGFGMPIVEANAVGRPVVAGNVTAMPEVAGDAACLVDPFDSAAIRAGIERVIGDAGYREALVQAGFRNAERFRPAAIARQYEALYDALAAAEEGA